jgi:cobalt-zinc-cadmium efflux system outer membrane protein
LPGQFSLDGAIRFALARNPEIAATRQQRGIATAGIIIADQYPFNPSWENGVRAAFGPESAAVTNSVAITERVGIDVEMNRQGRIRREAAAATLSRTEWEIAGQEVTLAIRTLRAFDTVVYRFRKRKLIEDTIALNERAARQVKDLAEAGRPGITRADVIVIDSEVLKSRSALNQGQAALVTAWQDLYRALGITQGSFGLHGGFEIPPVLENKPEDLLLAALERRPDLRAHQVAVAEADARVRLEVANRWGNPNIGPAYEYNETRTNFVGLQVTLPIPVLNTHRGEIQQREAEHAQALLQLRQNEVLVRQDIRAAVARLDQARKWVSTNQKDVVPGLEKGLKDIQSLFENRAAGVDLLRVLDVQRNLLQARDVELDAIYELRQALADLALAVGDPTVAVPHESNP